MLVLQGPGGAQLLDLFGRELEDLTEDVVGVLSVAGTRAVEPAADVGRRLREAGRVLLHWPGPDLALVQLDHPAQVRQLRVALVAVLRGLAHARRDAAHLQRVRQTEAVPGPGGA